MLLCNCTNLTYMNYNLLGKLFKKTNFFNFTFMMIKKTCFCYKKFIDIIFYPWTTSCAHINRPIFVDHDEGIQIKCVQPTSSQWNQNTNNVKYVFNFNLTTKYCKKIWTKIPNIINWTSLFFHDSKDFATSSMLTITLLNNESPSLVRHVLPLHLKLQYQIQIH